MEQLLEMTTSFLAADLSARVAYGYRESQLSPYSDARVIHHVRTCARKLHSRTFCLFFAVVILLHFSRGLRGDTEVTAFVNLLIFCAAGVVIHGRIEVFARLACWWESRPATAVNEMVRVRLIARVFPWLTLISGSLFFLQFLFVLERTKM